MDGRRETWDVECMLLSCEPEGQPYLSIYGFAQPFGNIREALLIDPKSVCIEGEPVADLAGPIWWIAGVAGALLDAERDPGGSGLVVRVNFRARID